MKQYRRHQKAGPKTFLSDCKKGSTYDMTHDDAGLVDSYPGSTFRGSMARMGVEKMSVSFDLELGEAIRAAANRGSQSVSAWLAEAARDRLRLEALGQAVASWERTFGVLGDAEIEAAERLLDSGKKKRSGAA